MMTPLRNLVALAVVALTLVACGSGPRITYSGHEESTEGVPGFVNGKKVSPKVKLGQSYSVDGDTYVPRHQPDYVEEGMASWYGPGFHGGKTANGEEFDKHAMTAAHRTLPLPSIVKVTLLSTGKSAYVRVNDRGPYAHSRIIDLSYAAAKEIGMIAKGTGRVRVEYQLAESQRFADLLAQGRSPESIDITEEVLPYAKPKAVQYASNQPSRSSGQPASSDSSNDSVLHKLSPVASANANEVDDLASDNDNQSIAVESSDLAAPVAAAPLRSYTSNAIQPRGDPPRPNRLPPPAVMAPLEPRVGGYTQSSPAIGQQNLYIQLGSFSQRENALRMQQKVAAVGAASISPMNWGSTVLYRVRMGPYAAAQASSQVLKLKQLGLIDTPVVRQ